MKDRIGYCGLNCEQCDAYLATIHNDHALRVKTAKRMDVPLDYVNACIRQI